MEGCSCKSLHVTLLATVACALEPARASGVQNSFNGYCYDLRGSVRYDKPLTARTADNGYRLYGTGYCDREVNGGPYVFLYRAHFSDRRREALRARMEALMEAANRTPGSSPGSPMPGGCQKTPRPRAFCVFSPPALRSAPARACATASRRGGRASRAR